MNQIIYGIICSFFVLSIILNIYLIFHIKTAIDKYKKDSEKTYDVRALMADLSQGVALVKMERIDPHDVLLHSPRQGR